MISKLLPTKLPAFLVAFFSSRLISSSLLSTLLVVAQSSPVTRPRTVGSSSPGFPDLGPGSSLHGKRVFPPDNPWNQDISNAPVDPNSANLIASIGNNDP